MTRYLASMLAAGLLLAAVFAVVATARGADTRAGLRAQQLRQDRQLRRYAGTLRFYGSHPRLARTSAGRSGVRRARVWVRVLQRELRDTRARRRALRRRSLQSAGGAGYWAARQIWAAEQLARESGGDPWPNCPDPHDGGGNWQATVQCENGGSWMDSPGYYRCGLQFDPMWEQRFGRLCP